MKSYVMLVLLLLVTIQLMGLVAFNGVNQRNHPELEWKTITTDNCRIIYHDPLEQQARLTATIAQNTFNTLVKTYQTTPAKTCIIYVSDQDNITNGAAALSFYIFIWINQNDFTGLFTGNDKWIRKVVSHELSHWFVAASIENWITLFIPVIPNFPRNINEGYAQYFSGEPWGYNRGDKYLKASILSQKQGIPSPVIEGNLMYADGFAKVRYLATMYGEDNLIKLLKYRGTAKFYSFKEAFEKVYKKDYSAFEEEWRRYVYTYYYGEVYDAKSATADTTSAGNINDYKKLKTDYYQFTGLDWKNNVLLYAARKSSSQKYYDLMLADVVSDSLKSDKLKLEKPLHIFKSGNFTKISLSENGKWAAFTVYSRHKAGRLAPAIYRYNAQKHKLHRLGEGGLPEIDSTGGIYYQKLGYGSNDIWYNATDNSLSRVYSLAADEQIGNLSLSPDNQKLAFTVFDAFRKFNISILDIPTGLVFVTLPLQTMAQSILWNNNNELLYTVENPVNFNLEIVQYKISEQSQQNFTDQAYNSVPIRYTADKMYVLADFDKGAKTPGYFQPQINQVVDKTFNENYYNKWLRVKPIYTIPDSTGNITVSEPQNYVSWRNLKWRLGFALPMYKYAAGGCVFSEALGKHLFGAFAAVPYSQKDKAWWLVMYENKTLAPTLDLMYSRQQLYSGLNDEKLYYQNMDKVSGKISFPINLTRSFREANLDFDVSYTDVKNGNDNPIFEDKGFASYGAAAGYAYNLPWKRSDLHKVRYYHADYSLQMATKQLGMNSDFNQHAFNAGFAYAPLLHIMSNELIRTIALENRTNYEFVNGDQLQQYLPGINKFDIIQSNNRPAFKRYFLRGYEENYLCKKILNVQTELNFKLMDDMNFGVLGDMLSVHYIGFALWHDYTELHHVLSSDHKNRSYNANGFELRFETNFLFVPTIIKYGHAYDNSFKDLSEYFLIELPFLEMIQSNL